MNNLENSPVLRTIIAICFAMVKSLNNFMIWVKYNWNIAYARGREIAISFDMDHRAFSTSLVGAALGVVILAIVVLDVAIPVITSAISTANLTGTTLTIANLIPMFLVLGLFVMVAVVFVIRWL